MPNAQTPRQDAETLEQDLHDTKAGAEEEKMNEAEPGNEGNSDQEGAAENEADKESMPVVDEDPAYMPGGAAATAEGFRRLVLSVVVSDYQGEMENGLYQRHGKITYKGGHAYEGEFDQGLMHGKGTFTWADGTVYSGDFSQGNVTGVGEYRWVDGSFYKGEVQDGMRHGLGVFHQPTMFCTYDGMWKNGVRHGQGKLYYGDKSDNSFYLGIHTRTRENTDEHMLSNFWLGIGKSTEIRWPSRALSVN